jgi:hypothetical protein
MRLLTAISALQMCEFSKPEGPLCLPTEGKATMFFPHDCEVVLAHFVTILNQLDLQTSQLQPTSHANATPNRATH